MPSGGVVLVEVRPGEPPPSPLRQGAQAVTVYAGGQSACAVSVLHWPFNVKDPTLANAQSINYYRPVKIFVSQTEHVAPAHHGGGISPLAILVQARAYISQR